MAFSVDCIISRFEAIVPTIDRLFLSQFNQKSWYHKLISQSEYNLNLAYLNLININTNTS